LTLPGETGAAGPGGTPAFATEAEPLPFAGALAASSGCVLGEQACC
jgi:hypothetical protein